MLWFIDDVLAPLASPPSPHLPFPLPLPPLPHLPPQVCATCHSLDKIHFRELVGVSHSAEELTTLAAEIDVEDGPNDEGEVRVEKTAP